MTVENPSLVERIALLERAQREHELEVERAKLQPVVEAYEKEKKKTCGLA